MAIYSPMAGNPVQGNLTVNPNQVNSSNKGGVSSQPVQPPANGATVSQPSMFGQVNQGGGMQQPMVAATGLNNQPMVVNGAQQPVQQPVQQPMQQPMQQQATPNIFNTAAQGMTQGIKAAGMETMYRPQTIAGTDLSAYMNPFENQVVGQSLQDLERARQMQANQLGAQASQAGAFGGSRQAIMESELGRNYLDQAARTASQLRLGGFQNAQQMAGQDIGYGLQGSQNRLNAASQLGQLSNLGFGQGMALQDQAMQQGALAQGINQMLIDATKGQYAGYTGAPAQSLQYLTGAIGASPTPVTQTTSRQPGLYDYLTMASTMFRG